MYNVFSSDLHSPTRQISFPVTVYFFVFHTQHVIGVYNDAKLYLCVLFFTQKLMNRFCCLERCSMIYPELTYRLLFISEKNQVFHTICEKTQNKK